MNFSSYISKNIELWYVFLNFSSENLLEIWKGMDWDKEARKLLRAELVRRDITYKDLVKRLEKIGVKTNEQSLKGKFSRGSFKASFMLQVLYAIHCDELKIKIDYNDSSEWCHIFAQNYWTKPVKSFRLFSGFLVRWYK